MIKAQVSVPPGVPPGHSFRANVNGQLVTVTVPPGVQAGTVITIDVTPRLARPCSSHATTTHAVPMGLGPMAYAPPPPQVRPIAPVRVSNSHHSDSRDGHGTNGQHSNPDDHSSAYQGILRDDQSSHEDRRLSYCRPCCILPCSADGLLATWARSCWGMLTCASSSDADYRAF